MQNSCKPRKKSLLQRWSGEKELWFWSLLFIAYWVIFFVIPIYGITYAFFDYTPGRQLTWDRFVGLKHFQAFFKTRDTVKIIRNTLVLSGLNMTIGFIMPVILALLLDELRQGVFKKVVQTISYLPYFISWVVVASLAISLLNSEGVVNEVLLKLGLVEKPVPFLTEGKYFWGLRTFLDIWKGLGWNTILYMSAIAGIDQSLYEAGAVDGITRWGSVKYITLPSIMPTIVLLFILSIGNLLNLGYEQNLLLGQSTTRDYNPSGRYDTLQIVLRNILIQSDKVAKLMSDATVGSAAVKSAAARISTVSMRAATMMIVTLPIIMVYPFFQKYFIKGISIGAVKG